MKIIKFIYIYRVLAYIYINIHIYIYNQYVYIKFPGSPFSFGELAFPKLEQKHGTLKRDTCDHLTNSPTKHPPLAAEAIFNRLELSFQQNWDTQQNWIPNKIGIPNKIDFQKWGYPTKCMSISNCTIVPLFICFFDGKMGRRIIGWNGPPTLGFPTLSSIFASDEDGGLQHTVKFTRGEASYNPGLYHLFMVIWGMIWHGL